MNVFITGGTGLIGSAVVAELLANGHAVGPVGGRGIAVTSVIGRRLGIPVASVPQDTYGPLGAIFATDQTSSSAHTRRRLGRQPTHPGLLEDLENIEP